MAPHGITTGQVLVTLEDSASRRRYLNSRATLGTLLGLGALPIVNENDTVATDEIRYGDNDRLAAQVAATGRPLFLEKPVATDFDQLHALRDAWRGREDRVVVSFPLRVTPIFRAAQEYIEAGRTGVINQVQACNNVAYGDVYYASWYRRYEHARGLWLQKATHDFDYLNLLVGARPVRVAAMMTQRVFGTGRVLEPDECGYYDRIDPGAEPEQVKDPAEPLADHGSRFHAAIRNQDAGSAIVWYENGVIVSYSQNFVPRKAAGRRGAIITGYDGTLDFDWCSEKLRWVDHHGDRVDRIECPGVGGHGGGDAMLVDEFYRVAAAGGGSTMGLTAGLQSVALCLAAREAARTDTVQPVEDMGLFDSVEPFDVSGVEP
jgi:predicted dehydrogenase